MTAFDVAVLASAVDPHSPSKGDVIFGLSVILGVVALVLVVGAEDGDRKFAFGVFLAVPFVVAAVVLLWEPVFKVIVLGGLGVVGSVAVVGLMFYVLFYMLFGNG